MDNRPPDTISFKREVGRRRIPGTHKVEIIYAIHDPLNPNSETYVREVMTEKEEGAHSN